MATKDLAVSNGPFIVLGEKFNLDPTAVLQVLKATVLKGTKNYVPTDADAAAFAIVCNAYDLNPFRREIHGYCDYEKGVVPIVGIDGWSTLVNRRTDYNGCDFDEVKGDDDWGITCTIFVKTREHPTRVTEWFKECVRETVPWRMKRRMLRHKAFMQCARLAFGMGGIYDEDEARDIVTSSGAPIVATIDPVTGLPEIQVEKSRAETVMEKIPAAKKPKKEKAAPAPELVVEQEPEPTIIEQGGEMVDTDTGELMEPEFVEDGPTPTSEEPTIETGTQVAAEQNAKKEFTKTVLERLRVIRDTITKKVGKMDDKKLKRYVLSVLNENKLEVNDLDNEFTFNNLKVKVDKMKSADLTDLLKVHFPE